MALPLLSLQDKAKEAMNPPFLTNNIATNNIATNNIATNNLFSDAPYFTYKLKADASKFTRGLGYKSPLEQKMEEQRSLLFDYNNPKQVNSWADVVMRTFTNVYDAAAGIRRWEDIASNTIEDVKALVLRGYVEPAKYGFKTGEWDILLNNQLVNFSETIDLFDAVYKGFVINGGLEDFEKGKQGALAVVRDRKNFDFDTGNKFVDWVLEIATPSNIALAGLSFGTAGVAKQIIEESGEGITKKVAKSFARNYTGDLANTFLKMEMPLTNTQIQALTDIATHKVNLQALQTLNLAKNTIDLFDSVGPRLAIKSTVGIPWYMLKGMYNVSEHMARYTMHAVERILTPNDTFISVLGKQAELSYVINNITEAGKLVGENTPAGIRQYAFKAFADKDMRALRKIRYEFSKSSSSGKLLKKYLKQVADTAGPGLDLHVASSDFLKAQYSQLFKKIDEFIVETSGGVLKNFDQYNAVITQVGELADVSESVRTLLGVVKQLEIDRVVYLTDEYGSLFTGLKEDLVNFNKVFRDDIDENAAIVSIDATEIENEILYTKAQIDLTPDAANKIKNNIKQRKVLQENYNSAVKELNDMKAQHHQLTLDLTDAGALDAAPTVQRHVPLTKSEELRLKEIAAINAEIGEIQHTLRFHLARYKTALTEKAEMEKQLSRHRGTHTSSEKNALVYFENLKVLEREVTLRYEQIQRIQDNLKLSLDDVALIHKYKTFQPEQLLQNINAVKAAEMLRRDELSKTIFAKTQEVNSIIRKLSQNNIELEELRQVQITRRNLYANLNQLYKDYNALRPKIKSTEELLDSKHTAYQHMTTTVDRLNSLIARYNKALGDASTQYERTIISSYLKVANSTKQQLISSYKEFVAALKEYNSGNLEVDTTQFRNVLITLNAKLSEVPLNIMTEYDVSAKVSRLSNLLYGKSTTETLRDMQEYLEKNAAHLRVNSFRTKVTDTFFKDGTFSIDAYDMFLKNIEDVYANLKNLDIGSRIGEEAGTTKAMAEVSEDFAYVMESLEETITKLKDAKFNGSADMMSDIETLYDTYITIKHKLDSHIRQIKRADKITQAEALSKYAKQLEDLQSERRAIVAWIKRIDKVSSEDIAELPADLYFVQALKEVDIKIQQLSAVFEDTPMLSDFDKIIDLIKEFESMFQLTADEVLEYAKSGLRTYITQANSVLRNMHLLELEDLNDMLDAVATRSWTDMPALEEINAISHWDTSKLVGLKLKFNTGFTGQEMAMALQEIGFKYNSSKYNYSDILTTIDAILQVQQYARVIMETLHGMVSVRHLYGMVSEAIEAGMSKGTAGHFLDALQRMYDLPPLLATSAELREYPNIIQYRIKQMVDNINNQLRSEGFKYNIKLTSWRDRIIDLVNSGKLDPKALDEYRTRIPEGMQHTAIADAYSEYLVHKYIFNDSDLTGIKFAYIDIEASGLNLNSSTIYQTSLVMPETGEFIWFINTGVTSRQMPDSDNIFWMLFGDEHRSQPIDVWKEKFKQIYQDGDVDELKRIFGFGDDIKIVACNGETELLTQFNKYLGDAKPATGKLMYRMHNGTEYDLPLLNNRARQLGVHRNLLNEFNLEDTKIMLEEKFGIKKLTDKEVLQIEDMIYRYLDHRKSEISALGQFRMADGVGDVSQMTVQLNNGNFLPTIDESFRDAYRSFKEIGMANVGASNFYGNTTNFLEDVDSIFESLSAELKRLSIINNEFANYQIHVVKYGEEGGKRIVPDDWFKDIPRNAVYDLANDNVGVDISYMNTVEGIYIPKFGVRKDTNVNLAINYFDSGNTKLTHNMVTSMTRLSSDIERSALKIKNIGLLETVPMQAMYDAQALIVDELRRLAGTSMYSPVYTFLKNQESPVTQFAALHMLYKKYKSVISTTKAELVMRTYEGVTSPMYITNFVDDAIKKTDPLLFWYLENPGHIMDALVNDYEEAARFFTIGGMSSDVQQILTAMRSVTRKSLDSLEAIEKFGNKLELTRLKKLIPVYRDMFTSFDLAHEIVDDVIVAVEKAASKTGTKKTVTPAQVYNSLRVMHEAYDSAIAYNSLAWFLKLSPEDMVSFVRHQAKTRVIFSNRNLLADTYSPIRRGAAVPKLFNSDLTKLYDELYQNKDKYEALGISFNFEKDYTSVYIKLEDLPKVKDVPYKEFSFDFNLIAYMHDILKQGRAVVPEIGKYASNKTLRMMKALENSRNKLIGLGKSGYRSTLEILDESAMDDIIKATALRTPGGVDLQTLTNIGAFNDNYFNYSILGHIDTRREFMPYSSFNPAKTMFHAASILENKLDAQVHFINYIQSPEMELKNVIKNINNITDEEVESTITYLRKSPHLKVAFLNGTKDGSDFKLSTVVLNNKKDLEFALSKNAVVIDRETYTKAYSVINNFKIKNPVLRFLDRALVAPFKIGWLAFNPGVVLRNIFDTGIKNYASTKDGRIGLTMWDMWKDYYNYQSAMREIYTLATEKNIKIEAAVERYFQGTPKVARDIYDMITEYEKAGGVMSKVREAQQYYGDSIDRMYRKIGAEDSGISMEEFKEVLKMPDDVAESWLKAKLSIPEPGINSILDVKHDLLTYKRAYEMHKWYKGQDITVENFVTYIKSGRVPEHHKKVFKEMMEKTKNVRAEADFLQKMMDHPAVAHSLSWNMQAEEILRLSMYRYLKNEGATPAEIMAEIERTHFNYDKKNRLQLYLEMIMPFSTFRINSIIYWAETMANSPQMVEIIGDTWSAVSGFKDRELDDVILRRSLRYQMYTGNVILNEDTGMTLKLNPSVIDALNFFGSPIDYVMNSFHSAGKAVYQLMTMERNSWESEENFLNRKKYYLWSIVPFIGGYANRYNSVAAADENGTPITNLVKTLVMAPLFNTTWTPAQSTYKPYVRKPWYPVVNMKQPRVYSPRPAGIKNYTQYQKKYRPKYTVKYGYRNWSMYSTFNRTMYGAQFKFRRGSAYPTKNSRSLNTAFSQVWRRTMTKKGNPKYRFLSFPTNKWTRQLKINMLRNITSYNRWQ